MAHIFSLTGHYLMKHLLDTDCMLLTCTLVHRGLIAENHGGTLRDTCCGVSIQKYQTAEGTRRETIRSLVYFATCKMILSENLTL